MDWTIEFDKAIEQYLPDLEVLQDEPMSRHTTFRIGGPAKRMAFPSSREQLVLLMSFAKDYGANPLVIGNGSNLLVPDEGLDRLVIDTSANLNRVERGSGNTVLADAGATLARTADLACKSGLTGLEFAHGIPGTVGGGSKTETPSTGSDNSSAEGATYKVGICQLVQHPALDAATQGFIDALNEALPGQVTFENKNASGEANNCGTIVNGFVSEGVDLIMANATAALTAAASATADIPILGTSITAYGVALDLDDFDGTVGGNISGTSDLADLCLLYTSDAADDICDV